MIRKEGQTVEKGVSGKPGEKRSKRELAGRAVQEPQGIRAGRTGRDRTHPLGEGRHPQHGRVRNAGRSAAGFLDTRLGGACEHPQRRRRQERQMCGYGVESGRGWEPKGPPLDATLDRRARGSSPRRQGQRNSKGSF